MTELKAEWDFLAGLCSRVDREITNRDIKSRVVHLTFGLQAKGRENDIDNKG